MDREGTDGKVWTTGGEKCQLLPLFNPYAEREGINYVRKKID